jgi:uncharacterized membrane protein
MVSYASRLRRDISRWVAAGLIDAATGDAILRDVDAHERGALSFGTILAVMAALLVGAAILVFVAANWEAIPRLARVGTLFLIIAGGHVAGAVLKLRGDAIIAEAVWLVAAAAFGGAIALIGQMYHLSGDETEAVLVWCAGTALAAALLRSGPLTVAATGLATFWLFARGVGFWRPGDFPHLFVAVAAGLWAISHWTESVVARHFLVMSTVLYATLLGAEYEVTPVAITLGALCVLLFGLAVVFPGELERVVHLDGLLPVHCLLGFLVAMVMLQIEIGDESGSGFAVAAALAFAGIGGAIVLAGRESRSLRWLAYLGFAVELCLVYSVMIGSMLGTAGFFLAAGLLLGLTALVIIRIERNIGRPAGMSEEAAR